MDAIMAPFREHQARLDAAMAPLRRHQEQLGRVNAELAGIRAVSASVEARMKPLRKIQTQLGRAFAPLGQVSQRLEGLNATMAGVERAGAKLGLEPRRERAPEPVLVPRSIHSASKELAQSRANEALYRARLMATATAVLQVEVLDEDGDGITALVELEGLELGSRAAPYRIPAPWG